MHGQRFLLAAMLGAVVACADAPHPLPPAVPAVPAATPPDRPTLAWSETSYPTEEEYAANGGGQASLSVEGPYAYITSSAFVATGTTRAEWVNSLNSTLVAEVVDGNGQVLNARSDPYTMSRYSPMSSGYRDHSAQVGTLGRTCGLHGKARIEANATLYAMNFGAGGRIYPLWADALIKHAGDASQPVCQRQEEEEVATCGDQFYCDPDGGDGAYPPPPSGDGGGGGGSAGTCTLYRITDEESYDGGATWHVVAEYYVWRCT